MTQKLECPRGRVGKKEGRLSLCLAGVYSWGLQTDVETVLLETTAGAIVVRGQASQGCLRNVEC